MTLMMQQGHLTLSMHHLRHREHRAARHRSRDIYRIDLVGRRRVHRLEEKKVFIDRVGYEVVVEEVGKLSFVYQ